MIDEDDKDTPAELSRPLGTAREHGPSERRTSSEHSTHAGPPASPSSSGVMGAYVRELRADAKPTKALLTRLDTKTTAMLAMLTARKPAPRLVWWLACAVLAVALLNLVAALVRQLGLGHP